MITMFNRDHDWLAVKEDVVLTPAIEKSIGRVRVHFALHQHRAYVTSGLRTPEAQIYDAISSNAAKGGIMELYPEWKAGLSGRWLPDAKSKTPEGEMFWWQRTWSKLLNLGFIVNPPIAAVCLYNSFRDNGSNRKGVVINATPHASGLAYDIGGGTDHRPNDEYAILLQAQKDPSTLITSMTLETMNNCVHVNIRKDG
jgi:hypothetical protein